MSGCWKCGWRLEALSPSVTFYCSGLSLACYDPRVTCVCFYQVRRGPKMPLRLHPRCFRAANTQNSAEACGASLTPPGDGPAPAPRHRANWSRGSRRRLLQQKYIPAGFLCISNSCERQIRGAAAWHLGGAYTQLPLRLLRRMWLLK